MENVCAIFIDGGYLNRVLKQQFKEKDIDFLKLCEVICEQTGTKRLRTYYYNCMPYQRKNNPEDRKRYEKMQKFITKLRRLPRFEVRLGRLQMIGKDFKQKMIDTLMSLDITNLCFSRHIRHAILIAGDSDFVPAIKQAKELGAIIHVYYHPSTVHNEILDQADELHKIDEDIIKKCLKK